MTAGSPQPPNVSDALRQLVRNPVFWVVLVAVVMLALFLWGAYQILIVRPAARSAPTATPIPKPYANDLYHFTVNQTASMEYIEGQDGCRGVTFSTDREGLYSGSPAYPRLSICYLEPASQNSLAFLEKRLDDRLKEIGKSRWTEAQEGLPKAASIGRQQAPGAERFIQGKAAVTGREVKWYEAITQYEGRLYAIEASCPCTDWDTFWPTLTEMMRSLQFHTGVIARP